MRSFVCEVCEKPFTAYGARRRTCSTACRAKLAPRIVHGAYRQRERTCDACGKRFIAHRLVSRFCSDHCRVQFGAWSFRAAHPTNERVLGVTNR